MDWNIFFPRNPEPEFFRIGALFNGIYTLVLPDGSHRTFRIATQYPDSWMPGKRIMGVLVGPDNTRDFEKFSFVDHTGIKIWKSLRGTGDRPSKYQQWADIIWRIANGETIEGYELLEARHCIKCNRLLTTESAILAGIGSTCEKGFQWER